MFLMNYMCYVLTEVLDFSSIFALFVCALLCGHYGHSSLSEEAQAFAEQLSEFFSYCAEAFVFGYFGLTAVGYLMDPDIFSLNLILFYEVILIASRFIAVLGLKLLLMTFRLHHSSVKLRHLCVIGLAGCMRGAIAYALILRAVPPVVEQTKQEKMLVSTVLGIVLINCLVFGGLFPVILGLLNVQPEIEE